MKYLIIGAGGTGGCLGAYLARAGQDVTLIARGEHLRALQSGELRVETTHEGNYTVPIKASSQEEYNGTPDVIIECVKGYSVDETIPFIRRVATPETVIIPILNIYGTGGKMQQQLPGLLVTDGCMYVSASIKEPGVVQMHGKLLRVIFGVREAAEDRPVLAAIAAEMKASGISTVLSTNIRHDTLRKFSFISAMATCGAYYNATAAQMREPGERRDTFEALTREMDALAQAMGIPFAVDIVATNLKTLDEMAPNAVASMQRDVDQGKPSEMDGLVFEPLRMGAAYGVAMPVYGKIAAKFGYSG